MLNGRIVITGAAGFIGSHLCEYFLQKQYFVIGIDNFITGYKNNIDKIKNHNNFNFYEADISVSGALENIIQENDIILHHAALGSVSRSIQDPLKTHLHNATGFLNVAWSCVRKKARRLIFASSSSVYGDSEELPKKENFIGRPLSPYAVSKISNEWYAYVFGLNYGLEWIGLRYFNVFGENQQAGNPYAAVIPLFIEALKKGERPVIYGDGQQARDFTYVKNVCIANEQALKADQDACNRIYNIGCGVKTTVLHLFENIRSEIGKIIPSVLTIEPEFRPERKGEIKNSMADISLAKKFLNYEPKVLLHEGLKNTIRHKLIGQNS
ncbi:MAG: NAD-dependent epimerase/dehydratase family protein [Bacteroidia bacterium]|nr:NAD-dependent epimerase/dehydratase family protein [Bacteroidia bacterium]